MSEFDATILSTAQSFVDLEAIVDHEQNGTATEADWEYLQTLVLPVNLLMHNIFITSGIEPNSVDEANARLIAQELARSGTKQETGARLASHLMNDRLLWAGRELVTSIVVSGHEINVSGFIANQERPNQSEAA